MNKKSSNKTKGAARKGSSTRSRAMTKSERNAKRRAKVRARKLNRNVEEKLDLRQVKFLGFYIDPKSDTYMNALQSALAAGYSQSYAENITAEMPDWLQESLGELTRQQTLLKAQQNLLRTVFMSPMSVVKDSDEDGNEFIIKDKEGNPVFEVDVDVLRIQHDANKFVTERLGKKHWSQKSPLVDEDGNAITLNVLSFKKEENGESNPTV